MLVALLTQRNCASFIRNTEIGTESHFKGIINVSDLSPKVQRKHCETKKFHKLSALFIINIAVLNLFQNLSIMWRGGRSPYLLHPRFGWPRQQVLHCLQLQANDSVI